MTPFETTQPWTFHTDTSRVSDDVLIVDSASAKSRAIVKYHFSFRLYIRADAGKGSVFTLLYLGACSLHLAHSRES